MSITDSIDTARRTIDSRKNLTFAFGRALGSSFSCSLTERSSSSTTGILISRTTLGAESGSGSKNGLYVGISGITFGQGQLSPHTNMH